MKPEVKLYNDLKRKVTKISWNRLENRSLLGTPDLLAYSINEHFFTLELKFTSAYQVRFSPHQIAFHYKHPKDSYILVKTPVPRSIKLYPGSAIKELVDYGPTHPPIAEGWEACALVLEA